ncbi:LCP family protein [Streptomyces sp. NA04227]|nr:LCP family protein [Streptomyces sp. NA04227]
MRTGDHGWGERLTDHAAYHDPVRVAGPLWRPAPHPDTATQGYAGPYGESYADTYGEISADPYRETSADSHEETSTDSYGDTAVDLYRETSADSHREGPYPDPSSEPDPESTAQLERFADRPSSRYGPRRTHARNPKRKRRKLRRVLLTSLAALVAATAGTYGWAETRLHREVDLGAYGDRPPPGKGTNYLIVGSDSRDGLSDDAVKDLHAGGGGGRRTDSIIVLHTGANGTSMVSLPRDSQITIPSHRDPSTGKFLQPAKDKLNATFAYGGPELLAHTIERNTGLRIDHYAEIGFAGFVKIVDAIGGVRMCLDRDIKDKKSGADLKKGCQSLGGRQALAFVRQRHQEKEGDLGRTQNQQKFLSSLAHQAAQPDTLLDPSSMYPAVRAGLDTLIVDKDMNLRQLTKMFRAVQSVSGGKGKQINVPVAGIGIPTPKGNVIKWDKHQSSRLFDELKNDRPVTTPKKRR